MTLQIQIVDRERGDLMHAELLLQHSFRQDRNPKPDRNRIDQCRGTGALPGRLDLKVLQRKAGIRKLTRTTVWLTHQEMFFLKTVKLDILGTGKSFIRMTYERFEKLAPAENFLVVTNARYKDLVLEQIPELGPEQVLCEPVGRNTAPCICYAAYGLQKRDPGAKMIVTPADHLILNEEDFRAIIGECLDFIDDRAALMTVGIKPTRPETGYGYIQVSDDRTISKVKCFTEKPNLELAQTFLQCGEFLWNSGIFVWKVGDIIEAVRTYLPEHHALFSDIQPVLGTSEEAEAIARVFSECRSISIDYGVMEKANNVYVRRGEFGWSDVGTWGSLYQHARKDRYANAKPEKGCYTDENTRSCIVSLPEGKVAVINGLKEYIVVDTEDVLLICPRSEEQNIKKFIDEVKYNEGDKHI